MQFLIKSALASRVLALSLLLAMMVLRVYDPAPLEILRLKTFDLYQVLIEPDPAPSQVVIVDVDEKSLNELGQWPWPRTRLATLIDKLRQAQAATVGFDVLFPEHDRTSPQNVAEIVAAYDAQTAAQLRKLKSNDEAMAAAMKRMRVVLGQSGFHKKIDQKHATGTVRAATATVGPDPSAFLERFPEVIRNIPELESAALGRGIVTIRPERDGIIRKMPMLVQVEGNLLPTLSPEILRVATGQTTTLVKTADYGVETVVIAGVAVPTDRNGKAWLHFKKHDPKIFVPAADVLADRADKRLFQGRIVLVGTSATGLFDLKATPVDSSMPGVEAHAQLINAILTQSLLQRPAWALGLEVTLTFVLGLALVWLLPRLGAAITIVLGAAIAASITAGSWWAFAQQKLVLDYAFPLLTAGGVTFLLILIGYLREELDRRQIRTAFGQYLSSDMVEQLAEDPDRLTLGGETRQMTIMFSDVRGFTTISETFKSNPTGLTLLINSLLTPLSAAVVSKRGTIDKYMGDNIMAFWNAPLPNEDHALNACQAALDMQDRLHSLNEERIARDEPPLEIGIGLNTGECVVGNMGSDLRFDYTVLGDAVNLASRLEGQTKSYGVRILIGAETAEAVGDRLALLPVDSVQVKGKTEPVDVHTIAGNEDMAQSAAFKALKPFHEQMHAAYMKRDLASAKKLLKKCKELAKDLPLEGLYQVFGERIERAAKAA